MNCRNIPCRCTNAYTELIVVYEKVSCIDRVPRLGSLGARNDPRVRHTSSFKFLSVAVSYSLSAITFRAHFSIHISLVMSSTQIRTLLQLPDVSESNARALAYLNSSFKSLDDLEKESDLEDLIEQAHQRLEDLDTKVRPECSLHYLVHASQIVCRSLARAIPNIPR